MADTLPTRAQFAANNPGFAATAVNSPERRAWLAAHPKAAAVWERIRDVERWLVANVGGDWDERGDASYRLWTYGLNNYQKAPAAGSTAPATPTPAATPSPTAGGDANAGARAIINQALDTIGLGSLGEWAWQQYLQGVPTSQIMLDVRNRPEYAARFPGMAELSKRGQAISEGEYIQLESTYRSIMRSYGIPESFYDQPDDFGRYIANGKSPQELAEQLDMAEQVASTDPRGQQLRAEMVRLYQAEGLEVPANIQGAVTAWFIDPDKAEPLIERQFRALVTGAAAQRTGFGPLSREEAEEIAGYNVSEEQAQTSFGQLANMGEFQTNLPGGGSDAVTRQDLLGAAFAGNTQAQNRVETTRRRRQGAFQGGGSFAAGQSGISGLGSA